MQTPNKRCGAQPNVREDSRGPLVRHERSAGVVKPPVTIPQNTVAPPISSENRESSSADQFLAPKRKTNSKAGRSGRNQATRNDDDSQRSRSESLARPGF